MIYYSNTNIFFGIKNRTLLRNTKILQLLSLYPIPYAYTSMFMVLDDWKEFIIYSEPIVCMGKAFALCLAHPILLNHLKQMASTFSCENDLLFLSCYITYRIQLMQLSYLTCCRLFQHSFIYSSFVAVCTNSELR